MIRVPLLQYLNLNKFIFPHQHGFLEKHSTGSQLLQTINFITQAVENGDCADVCYTEFFQSI